jgi:CheY-like chemotaxis protein
MIPRGTIPYGLRSAMNHTKTILVVEDEVELLSLVVSFLRRERYAVVKASDVAEAVS